MPNISFDIFFDQDFINVTATRGKTAPKAKPEWKVRSAPKLPPKQIEQKPGEARPPPRAKINEGRKQVGKPDKPAEDTSSQADEKPKRKPAKLGPKKSAATNGEAKSDTVSSAGGFVGGGVNAVGNAINGVGEGLNRTVKGYGDGVKDYGNGVMDWTGTSGASRGATAGNPLGLAGTKTSGKRSTTSPSVYHAPKTIPTASGSQGKKVGPAPANKSLPAPSKAPAVKAPTGSGAGAARKPGPTGSTKTASGKTTISAASRPGGVARKTPGNPTAGGPKPSPATSKPASKGGYPSTKPANPLGLTWDEKKK